MAAEPATMISGFGRHHTNKDGKNPYTRISLSDIRKLVDEPQEVDKAAAQWLIPSSLETREHAEQAKDGKFQMLWADVDWKESAPKPMTAVASYVAALTEGADYELYASRGATEDRQKCRILIPLGEPLCGADWIDCQREFNALLAEAGIEPDDSSERPGQLCYLPNRGQWYESISRRGGVLFDPMAVWANLIADRRRVEAEQAEAVRLEREKAKRRKESLKSSQVGNGAQSLIAAFNQAFHVADILIQAGYDQRGNTFRHPNSETGSFSASVKDGRVHTLSSADPLWSNGEGAHDAFSAFCVLFHRGDMAAALRDAGDNWITIGSESWNQVHRRKFADARKAERERDEFAETGPTRPFREPIKLDLDSMPAIEWGVDGFTSLGLTIIAGSPGVGKTNAILPVAAYVAHLTGAPKEEDIFTLRPVLRRHVIVVTEAPEQVHGILYGIRHHLMAGCGDETNDWIHVVPAERIDPDAIGEDIRAWRKKYTYRAGPDLGCYMIEPVIIIDTANANLELENENDNAEVGRACAAIKTALMTDGEMKGQAWLVAHTPKALKRVDVEMMSVRGASAWEGDANATIYLVSDDAIPDKRFMTLGKRRFVPEFREIEITSEVHNYTATTKWGQTQRLAYMVCTPTPLASNNSRAAQSAKAQSAKYAGAIIELLEREYQATKETGGDWYGVTPTQMEGMGIGKAVNVRQSLGEMTQAGTLKSKTEGFHKTAPTFYWLPSQIRAEYQAPKKGRSRDVATTETPEKESHCVG